MSTMDARVCFTQQEASSWLNGYPLHSSPACPFNILSKSQIRDWMEMRYMSKFAVLLSIRTEFLVSL